MSFRMQMRIRRVPPDQVPLYDQNHYLVMARHDGPSPAVIEYRLLPDYMPADTTAVPWERAEVVEPWAI